MSEEEVKQQLRAFIVKTSGYTSEVALADDLLVCVEHLRGTPHEVENLLPGVFRDDNSIFANFFSETSR